jgi:hypothetical protein
MLNLTVRKEPQAVEETSGIVNRRRPMARRPLHRAGEVNGHSKEDDAAILDKWEHGNQMTGMIKWEPNWIPW